MRSWHGLLVTFLADVQEYEERRKRRTKYWYAQLHLE
jgi:hypothetical protein